MQQQLILDLFDADMIKFGEFTLKSGKQSYIYADIRTAISYPKIYKHICDLFYTLVEPLKYDFICGVPYSALTFASAIAYEHSIPMLLKRKEAKEYGTKKILEGSYQTGQQCVLIEDVITTGASILETIDALKAHGVQVTDICTLIDRNQGGADKLREQGYNVYSIMNLHQIIDVLYTNKKISELDKNSALALI